MIILLYGPNSYLRQKKLREIISEFEKKNGNLGHESFDLKEPGKTTALIDFCSSCTLFSPKRLAVVTGSFAADDDKQLKSFLKGDIKEDEDAVLVLNEQSKPPAAYKFILENSKLSQEFGELEEKQLDVFIKKEAGERGAKLKKEDIEELKNKWGNDLWGLVTELDVLSLGGSGSKSENFPEFFPLVNKLKYGGDIGSKLIALEYLMDGRGDDPAYVFNMVSFGVKEVRKLRKLADYDLSVKKGGLEYEEVLLDLVLAA
ncbi:MAG: hypothetical protein KGJ01_02230 [Patescibacteria group bacterium]|nr:hypothetical protein [Patescibacteria group bacterium]